MGLGVHGGDVIYIDSVKKNQCVVIAPLEVCGDHLVKFLVSILEVGFILHLDNFFMCGFNSNY